MPNDYMTLKALAAELTSMLSSGRINRINMPSEDEIVIELRAQGKNRTLILCARKPIARWHLTESRFAASPAPSAFCMLLRKHLTGGIIEGFSLYNADRIAVCDIASKNELHDLMRYKLIAELGGSPNVIFAKEDMTIIDCLRRNSGESGRSLLPNLNYAPPSQNKSNLFESDIANSLYEPSDITAKFVGASRETALEIGLLAASSSYAEVIGELGDIYNSPRFAPCVQKDNNGGISGYFAFPYSSAKDALFAPTPTLNAAFDAYYIDIAAAQNKHRATAGIRHTLNKLISKNERKLADNESKLSECAGKERLLQMGELIKCNAHIIRTAQSKISVYDFYNDTEIEITLDPSLSPMKNAAAYFRKYSKLKGAEAYAVKEKKELMELGEYLSNIRESLETCSDPTEYAEIAAEIAALTGGAPERGKNNKKQRQSEPICLEIGGFTVYIGKNNIQNDNITFKIASGRDIWLHAKGYHGSHAVIITNGKEVPNSVLEKTAAFAAYMSEAKASQKADVDYTRRANVKRLGKPGLVTYSDYKTITVKPTQLPLGDK